MALLSFLVFYRFSSLLQERSFLSFRLLLHLLLVEMYLFSLLKEFAPCSLLSLLLLSFSLLAEALLFLVFCKHLLCLYPFFQVR